MDEIPEEISAVKTAELHAGGEILLIDCREVDEHATTRIEGAKLVPLSTWATAFPDVFPADKDAAIVIHCHHGMRSLRATRFLRQQGYNRVQSMAGGIEEWSLEVDPSVPRY
jgi:rhodanese-related sulfurtransferase